MLARCLGCRAQMLAQHQVQLKRCFVRCDEHLSPLTLSKAGYSARSGWASSHQLKAIREKHEVQEEEGIPPPDGPWTPAAASSPLPPWVSSLLVCPADFRCASPTNTCTDSLNLSVSTSIYIYRYSRPLTYKPSSCKLSKMQTCVPPTTSTSETAACPPSLVADDPSALPSPPSSPSSSQ